MADPAAAPPRSRPTTFDTNDSEGTEILAHIFMRVPIALELPEAADAWTACLVRHPPAPKVRKKGEDEKEQGATARIAVESRCPCCDWCWIPANGELCVVATLPKAVTGAINVSNSNWVVNFVMIQNSLWFVRSKAVWYKIIIKYSLFFLTLVKNKASNSINRIFQ
jgi:hypothetical protein